VRQILASFLLFWISLSSVVLADEQVSVQKTYTKLTVSAEYKTIERGETTWLAVTLTPRTGWHTYWDNAGDTAFPPSLTWKVPEGITVGAPLMEIPEFIPLAPLASYGYKRTSSILLPLTISEDYEGEGISIHLKAEWLVCAEICVPEDGEGSISVNIGTSSASIIAAPIFERSRAMMPKASPFDSALNLSPTHARLAVALDNYDERSDIDVVRFFPITKGVLSYIAEQEFQWTETGFALTAERAKGAHGLDAVAGLVKMTMDDGTIHGFLIEPTLSHDAMTVMSMPLWQLLLFSLIGGVILNLMPCVFPVLSLKALSFLRAGDNPDLHRKEQGLYYTLGILLSFALIAFVLVALRASGEAAGWGFQLQDPRFVAVMTFILLSVGLSLLGVFNISFGVEATGQEMASKDGRKGAFFTGLLATLVATPCTAPFMAPALGFALTQSVWIVLASFIMLGLGLALPFLLLSFNPRLAKYLPKSGGWMERLKQALAFPMFLTVAWLMWVFTNQTSSQDAFILTAMLVVFAFGLWMFQQSANKFLRIFSVLLMLLSVVTATVMSTPRGSDAQQEVLNGTAYNGDQLKMLLSENKPVFVYFTADWCITCKVNETVALKRDSIADLAVAKGITIMKGDWTSRSDEIAAVLRQNSRVGVPLYLWYPSGANSKQQLPEILTMNSIRNIFEAVE